MFTRGEGIQLMAREPASFLGHQVDAIDYRTQSRCRIHRCQGTRIARTSRTGLAKDPFGHCFELFDPRLLTGLVFAWTLLNQLGQLEAFNGPVDASKPDP